MKHLFSAMLLTGSFLLFGCNPSDNGNTKDEDENEAKNDKDEDKDDVSKAAVAYCDCINENVELSSKSRKMIIKASKSDNPEQALQEEVMKITDEEDQVKIGQEFQQLESGSGINECSEKIQKKYKFKEGDTKVQRKLMKELEENDDCDLVAALMRIGMAAENQSSDDIMEDEEQ